MLKTITNYFFMKKIPKNPSNFQNDFLGDVANRLQGTVQQLIS